jgi:hypothetical protein
VDSSGAQVIGASRLRPMLLLGLALAMSAASGWLHAQQNGAAAGRLGLVVFGLVALFALLALIWRPRLVLDAQGLQFRSLAPVPRRCAWDDIERIELQRLAATRFVKIVMKPGRGSDLALGGSWPMAPDHLAAVIEVWRTKHAGSHVAA